MRTRWFPDLNAFQRSSLLKEFDLEMFWNEKETNNNIRVRKNFITP